MTEFRHMNCTHFMNCLKAIFLEYLKTINLKKNQYIKKCQIVYNTILLAFICFLYFTLLTCFYVDKNEKF